MARSTTETQYFSKDRFCTTIKYKQVPQYILRTRTKKHAKVFSSIYSQMVTSANWNLKIKVVIWRPLPTQWPPSGHWPISGHCMASCHSIITKREAVIEWPQPTQWSLTGDWGSKQNFLPSTWLHNLFRFKKKWPQGHLGSIIH